MDVKSILIKKLGVYFIPSHGVKPYLKTYGCHCDGTYPRGNGSGIYIGCTKAAKGMKIMIMDDARGLPIARNTGLVRSPEGTLVETNFSNDFERMARRQGLLTLPLEQ